MSKLPRVPKDLGKLQTGPSDLSPIHTTSACAATSFRSPAISLVPPVYGTDWRVVRAEPGSYFRARTTVGSCYPLDLTSAYADVIDGTIMTNKEFFAALKVPNIQTAEWVIQRSLVIEPIESELFWLLHCLKGSKIEEVPSPLPKCQIGVLDLWKRYRDNGGHEGYLSDPCGWTYTDRLKDYFGTCRQWKEVGMQHLWMCHEGIWTIEKLLECGEFAETLGVAWGLRGGVLPEWSEEVAKVVRDLWKTRCAASTVQDGDHLTVLGLTHAGVRCTFGSPWRSIPWHMGEMGIRSWDQRRAANPLPMPPTPLVEQVYTRAKGVLIPTKFSWLVTGQMDPLELEGWALAQEIGAHVYGLNFGYVPEVEDMTYLTVPSPQWMKLGQRNHGSKFVPAGIFDA